jgi:hypothetical protein
MIFGFHELETLSPQHKFLLLCCVVGYEYIPWPAGIAPTSLNPSYFCSCDVSV